MTPNALTTYAKAHTALIGSILTVVSTQFGGNVYVHTYLPIVLALLTAAGVYVVPNATATTVHTPDKVAAPGPDPSLETKPMLDQAPALTLNDPHPAAQDPDHAVPQFPDASPADAPVANGSTPIT